MLLAVPFFSVIFLLPLVGLILGIMTAVDVSKYPEWAFGQTGASKTVWQVLPVVLGLFCFGIGGRLRRRASPGPPCARLRQCCWRFRSSA